jgi:hypothetical protein
MTQPPATPTPTTRRLKGRISSAQAKYWLCLLRANTWALAIACSETIGVATRDEQRIVVEIAYKMATLWDLCHKKPIALSHINL